MSTKNVKLSDVNVGDSLPELPIPLTTSLIVGGAVASRDFTPVHHDKSAAQAAGMHPVGVSWGYGRLLQNPVNGMGELAFNPSAILQTISRNQSI